MPDINLKKIEMAWFGIPKYFMTFEMDIWMYRRCMDLILYWFSNQFDYANALTDDGRFTAMNVTIIEYFTVRLCDMIVCWKRIFCEPNKSIGWMKAFRHQRSFCLD